MCSQYYSLMRPLLSRYISSNIKQELRYNWYTQESIKFTNMERFNKLYS